MENNNSNNRYEILKRKKIRKILLLATNEELKDILKYKSNIQINSKTIPELNKLYTLKDIQLYEKPIIYSNYVKTEESILPKIKLNPGPPIKISKSLAKIRGRKKSKKIIERPSLEEDSVSPSNSYIPKKVELGRKKLHKTKTKNKGSIPNINRKRIYFDKNIDNKKPQSTRMSSRDIHINKLIERITIIKDNKNSEDFIKKNIQKLRKYCYQLRK